MRVPDPLDIDRDVPAAVGAHLAGILEPRVAETESADAAFAADLARRVVDFTVRGGSRLRSEFLWWALRGCGGGAPEVRPALGVAGALELLQTCALIHDDVMDGSPLRRGRPAVHVRLDGRYKTGGRALPCGTFGGAPATRPATPRAAEPATAPATRPATPRAAEPATAPATRPATARATQPATPRAAEPATAPATRPATPRAAQPATARAAEPATARATPPADLDRVLDLLVSCGARDHVARRVEELCDRATAAVSAAGLTSGAADRIGQLMRRACGLEAAPGQPPAPGPGAEAGARVLTGEKR
ncbi:polyprenyl synthetase family protein [Streptomyces sp. NPDC096136]|uniref:polyprenyl synthetase family protein n=1 Tax=Streptomyces sp. NPDC096136 TaxID=3366076 RepID=UPI003821DA6D